MKWAMCKQYKVKVAEDRQKALEIIRKVKPNVVLLDLGLPPCENDATEGLACLEEILAISSQTKVIVVTGNDERENALKAIGIGAYDFYQKPVNLDVLKVILERAFNLINLEQEYRELRSQLSGLKTFEGMIGFCPEMQEVFNSIKKVASTDATVLITGGSGTGKELVASAIHRRSLRKSKPFVPINCGAIPESLIESELFGYEKGAFTDAKSRKIGLLEKASGGTLFLDEISELPLQLQVKLLRFIQERKIQRVGGTEEIEVDQRIIAATNVNLEKAVQEGLFREDLFFRISVVNIALPPLKKRADDILILSKIFLSRFNRENRKNVKGFSPEAIQALKSYNWPGNVRELENKIQRAVVMTDHSVIETSDLSLSYNSNNDQVIVTTNGTLSQIRARAEITAIQNALLLHSDSITKAAEALGITRPTLHNMMNKYGLKAKASKPL